MWRHNVGTHDVYRKAGDMYRTHTVLKNGMGLARGLPFWADRGAPPVGNFPSRTLPYLFGHGFIWLCQGAFCDRVQHGVCRWGFLRGWGPSTTANQVQLPTVPHRSSPLHTAAVTITHKTHFLLLSFLADMSQ